MLELVKNIEFIKNKNLRVEKINDKEFFLENEKEKFILNLFPYGKFSKIKIQKQLVLKHPEAQLGRQRRVPAIQPGRRQLLFQRAVRPPSLPLAGVQGQQRRLPCVHPVLLLLQLTLLFPAGAASAPSGSQFLTPNSPTGVPGGNRRQTSAGSQAPEAL